MKKVMLSSLVLASFLAACGNDDSNKDSNDDSKAEVATTEKPTTEAPTTEAPTTEAPTTEAPATAGENNVYGKVGSDYKEQGAFFVNSKGNISLMGDADNIYQAEKSLDKGLGITVENDLSFLTDHATDFMEDDATQIEKKSDNEFIYESKKLNKKYNVLFSRPDGKTVDRIIVSQSE